MEQDLERSEEKVELSERFASILTHFCRLLLLLMTVAAAAAKCSYLFALSLCSDDGDDGGERKRRCAFVVC
jgi:hypothetical protein